MKRKQLRFIGLLLTIGVIAALVLGVAACSSTTVTDTVTDTVAPMLSSIVVTPASPASLAVGSALQFTATGTYSDGSTANISSQVTWSSDTTTAATIASYGLATSVAAGTANITATLDGIASPSVALTVVSLSSIAVTPASPSLAVGATQQFTATATYSDGTTADISSQVTWASDTPTAATIDSTGLATGVAAGTANITATMDGVTSPAVSLTVTSS
jgi:uncharacterized protein YjdB